MSDVTTIARDIVAREGGFVNDPDDPGGATKHGITLATLRRLGLDLNGDGRIDANDVRKLTQEQAVQIMVENYFRRPGIAALPAVLHASVRHECQFRAQLGADPAKPDAPDGDRRGG